MANGNFGGGDGTASNPYLIEDSMDFYNIRNLSKNVNIHFEITKNIDMSKPPFSTSGLDWTPIIFKGSLDGKQHKISNLTVSNKLFNEIGSVFNNTNGTIKNILFENINITPTSTTLQSRLSIFGESNLLSKIENIGIKNSKIESKSVSTGQSGFIFSAWNGYLSAGSYIKNVIIENCEFNLNYDGYMDVCFLIGSSSHSIDSSVSLSNISIAKCKMSSHITQSLRLRLIKESRGIVVENVFVDLEMLPSGKARIADTFSLLLGGSTAITNSYYNKEKYNTYVENGGLTKDEMKLSNSYNGWDLADTWIISKNGYPELRIYKAFENKSLILHDGEYKRFSPLDLERIKLANKTFTSSSSVGGEKVTASSQFTEDMSGWGAFNGNNKDELSWATSVGVVAGWLKYQFSTAKKIVRYSITGAIASRYMTRNPKKWTFEGSNDDSDWTVLDARSNVVFTTGETKEFYFDNDKKYLFYRWNITSTDGDIQHLQINEIKMYEYCDFEWSTVSDSAPSFESFLKNGMELPMIRKVVTLNPLPMTDKSEILPVGEAGKVFSKTLDLNKYIDIRSIIIK